MAISWAVGFLFLRQKVNLAPLHDQATDREETHEKGRGEYNIEIACNMKNEGFDTAVISKMTGLSTVEIERLG